MNYRRWFVGVPCVIVFLSTGIPIALVGALSEWVSDSADKILGKYHSFADKMKVWIREKDNGDE